LLGTDAPGTLPEVMTTRPILVAGATGNVGGAVVRALADAGVPVRALARSGHAPTLPAGAEAVSGDLDDPASLAGPLDGAEAAFLLPGFSDMPGVLARARAAGVARVVLLSGSSAEDDEHHRDDAITRYMRESERAVREGGVPWTVLRPSGFATNALEWRDQLREGDTVRAPFADVRIAVIDPADIGAAAAVALRGDAHTGQALRLTGPEPLTVGDRVRILGEALGRPLRLEPKSDDETHAEMSASMPPQYVDAFFSYYVEGKLDESVVLPTVEEVTGRPPRTFAQWAAANAEAFA
jgi:uncharacterized protein YbjT (DUF2867 family)